MAIYPITNHPNSPKDAATRLQAAFAHQKAETDTSQTEKPLRKAAFFLSAMISLSDYAFHVQTRITPPTNPVQCAIIPYQLRYRKGRAMKIYSSREFNQRTNQAQKAAHAAPVLITNRGRPDLVLMSHAEFLRLSGKPKSILEALAALPDAADIELEIPPRSTAQRRPVELD